MLRSVSVEAVSRQNVATGKQLEAIAGNDEMQVACLATYGAIALGNLQLGRRKHLESDATAVTTPCVCDHASSCLTTQALSRRAAERSAPAPSQPAPPAHEH